VSPAFILCLSLFGRVVVEGGGGEARMLMRLAGACALHRCTLSYNSIDCRRILGCWPGNVQPVDL